MPRKAKEISKVIAKKVIKEVKKVELGQFGQPKSNKMFGQKVNPKVNV